MASEVSTGRRVPQQERAERRVAELLDAAASVLAEVGYDAATMTAIAERAGASIGAVYQYFPNKEAVVEALRTQYGDEMEENMARLDTFAAGLSAEQLAHWLIDDMVRFVDEHFAYFAVVDAPVKFKRRQEARHRLRERLGGMLRVKKRTLSPQAALRMANVSIQIMKGVNSIQAGANPRERRELVDEYKLALGAYLQSRLGS